MKPFKARVNELALAGLSEDALKRKLRIDTSLDPDEITDAFLETYALLEPFGVGNPSPVFVTEDVDVVRAPQKLKGRHCKVHVSKGGRTIEAIAWDKAEWADSLGLGRRVSLAYSLQFSDYLGEHRPYLSLEDIRT
jgi:single-stranded-DNA-specific exonuclease